MQTSNKGIVNAWTEFGTLETCLIGVADDSDCNFETEPTLN